MLISKSNNEKDKEKSMVSRIVYQGHSANCRISHLTCQQQYSFRVRTTSHDDSHLVVSNLLTITTPEQQPGNANKNHKKNKQQTLQQQIQLQQQQIQQQQLLLQQQQLQGNVANNKEKDGPRLSSDQRWAILILLLFSSFAVIIAVLIEHFFTN
jgi:preprotein translocase subunit SecF